MLNLKFCFDIKVENSNDLNRLNFEKGKIVNRGIVYDGVPSK